MKNAHDALLDGAIEEHRKGNLTVAIHAYKLLAVDCVTHADSLHLLGVALHQENDFAGATRLIRWALRVFPDAANFHSNLGMSLVSLARIDAAAAAYRRALILKPSYAEAHNNLGLLLNTAGRTKEAIAVLNRALIERPDYVEALCNLATAIATGNNITGAQNILRYALVVQPDCSDALNNIGAFFQKIGVLEEGKKFIDRAQRSNPASMNMFLNLSYIKLYDHGQTNTEMLADARVFQERFCQIYRNQRAEQVGRTARNIRPRLGFVSGDFRSHAVGYLVLPTLQALRRAGWEIALYSNSLISDAVTEKFTALASPWRNIRSLADDAAAAQIRSDGIDILFDLSGYSGDNRLPVFLRRPAPVQITWLGYPGTTGVPAMDFIIADRHQLPADVEKYYTERVIRMPESYIAYAPLQDMPEPGPLPALSAGYVTFGSFNTLQKITHRTIGVWADILRSVSDSRLLMKTPGLSNLAARDRMTAAFSELGVTADRLTFLPGTPPHQHCAAMAMADLALDSFPYSGGLTTLECLWMGVPVITCPGETFASRHSLGYLRTIGADDWIATDLADYVERAIIMASDLPGLAVHRAGLRAQMVSSPLGNVDDFAGQLGEKLQSLWADR